MYPICDGFYDLTLEFLSETTHGDKCTYMTRIPMQMHVAPQESCILSPLLGFEYLQGRMLPF